MVPERILYRYSVADASQKFSPDLGCLYVLLGHRLSPQSDANAITNLLIIVTIWLLQEKYYSDSDDKSNLLASRYTYVYAYR